VTLAAVLYTPEVLALATNLAKWPWDEAMAFQGEARSPTCGSTIAVGLALAPDSRIDRVGLRVHACAIGQGSAAIFAAAAPGLDRDAIAQGAHAIEQWLRGSGSLPDWPGLSLIAAARDYSARHGAILLPWKAALAALPSS
jgi:NifU-like protein involved in Fe-S cluster formation